MCIDLHFKLNSYFSSAIHHRSSPVVPTTSKNFKFIKISWIIFARNAPLFLQWKKRNEIHANEQEVRVLWTIKEKSGTFLWQPELFWCVYIVFFFFFQHYNTSIKYVCMYEASNQNSTKIIKRFKFSQFSISQITCQGPNGSQVGPSTRQIT